MLKCLYERLYLFVLSAAVWVFQGTHLLGLFF
jgi:hypothetical protein